VPTQAGSIWIFYINQDFWIDSAGQGIAREQSARLNL
jgi:hypothetical protein